MTKMFNKIFKTGKYLVKNEKCFVMESKIMVNHIIVF